MKKSLLIALISATTFFGCSKSDPDTIVLNPSEVTLKKGSTHQISVTSKSTLTYETENDFHAEVTTEGKVTAGYVGETNIVVKNAEDSKMLKVTVEPSLTLYKNPELDFTMTKTQIIQKLGNPNLTNGQTIGYETGSQVNPLVMYLFDESNKLKSSAVAISTTYTSQLGDHLRERYVAVDSKDYTLLLLNGNTLSKTTLAVGASLANISTWLVMYMPYTNGSRVSAEGSKGIFEAFKELSSGKEEGLR